MKSINAGRNWPHIEAAYMVWEMIGDIDRTPTQDEAREIRKRIDPFPGLTGRKVGEQVQMWRIIRWFEQRDLYSPWVDELAIERAVAFDWAVIDRLTARESDVFIDRLADLGENWSSHMIAEPFGTLGRPYRDDPFSAEKRHQRYMEGSDLDRQAVTSRVSRRRAARARNVTADVTVTVAERSVAA